MTNEDSARQNDNNSNYRDKSEWRIILMHQLELEANAVLQRRRFKSQNYWAWNETPLVFIFNKFYKQQPSSTLCRYQQNLRNLFPWLNSLSDVFKWEKISRSSNSYHYKKYFFIEWMIDESFVRRHYIMRLDDIILQLNTEIRKQDCLLIKNFVPSR